jgi:5-formyltetrahydrofolate cyclo-ligase
MIIQPETLRKKHQLRAEAHNRRRRQSGADALAGRIFAQVTVTPEYCKAKTVLCYVSFRSEVCTRKFLQTALADGKRLVVPYCVEDRLELFRVESLTSDLAPGTWGILEPTAELRTCTHRHVAAGELDLVVVPGLALDRQCGRIGYGKGYFDRLLLHVRPETALVAVAFECQMFDEVPMLEHDVRVDKIMTESAVYVRSLPRNG